VHGHHTNCDVPEPIRTRLVGQCNEDSCCQANTVSLFLSVCAEELETLGDQAFQRLEKELGVDNTFGRPPVPLEQLDKFIWAYDLYAAALLLNTAADLGDPVYRPADESLMRQMYQRCKLPSDFHGFQVADWPLGLWDFNQFQNKTDMSQFDKEYEAYHEWCNPKICSKLSKKGNYLRVMQGIAAFWGEYVTWTFSPNNNGIAHQGRAG
jgi:hypothetical protein